MCDIYLVSRYECVVASMTRCIGQQVISQPQVVGDLTALAVKRLDVMYCT